MGEAKDEAKSGANEEVQKEAKEEDEADDDDTKGDETREMRKEKTANGWVPVKDLDKSPLTELRRQAKMRGITTRTGRVSLSKADVYKCILLCDKGDTGVRGALSKERKI